MFCQHTLNAKNVYRQIFKNRVKNGKKQKQINKVIMNLYSSKNTDLFQVFKYMIQRNFLE